MIHTVKGFSIVNEADIFLEFPCFLYDPMDADNFISGSSAFSKPSFSIWKFLEVLEVLGSTTEAKLEGFWALTY